MSIEISSATSLTTPRADSTKLGLTSDFETFLKMLTVQMQNQDPLNPVDSSDYAVQLATFSGVEQQVRTNALLEQMVTGATGSGLNNFASWLGKEALSPTAIVWNGAATPISVEVPEAADTAELVVLDQEGIEVLRQSISPNSGMIDWVGSDGSTTLPSGSYELFVASYSGDTLLEFTQAHVYNTVSEVRSENGAIIISFANGSSVEASKISGLRD